MLSRDIESINRYFSRNIWIINRNRSDTSTIVASK
jgi:hypothetical protein